MATAHSSNEGLRRYRVRIAVVAGVPSVKVVTELAETAESQSWQVWQNHRGVNGAAGSRLGNTARGKSRESAVVVGKTQIIRAAARVQGAYHAPSRLAWTAHSTQSAWCCLTVTSGWPADPQRPCGPRAARRGWWQGSLPGCAPPQKRCACSRWAPPCCSSEGGGEPAGKAVWELIGLSQTTTGMGTYPPAHNHAAGNRTVHTPPAASLAVHGAKVATWRALGEGVAAPRKRVLAPRRHGVLQGKRRQHVSGMAGWPAAVGGA